MPVANRYQYFHSARPEKVVKSELSPNGELHMWLHDGSCAPIVEVVYDPATRTGRCAARYTGWPDHPLTKAHPVRAGQTAPEEWLDLARKEIDAHYAALV